MSSLAKPKTPIDEIYFNFVKTLPCCACNEASYDPYFTIPHHTSVAGTSKKGSDYHLIPLCHECHDRHDRMGKVSFYDDMNIDRWECVAKTEEAYLISLQEGL